jgi:hypothetical protein
MVLRLARNFLDVPKELSKMNRTRFVSPILPDVPVVVKITYDADAGKVTFAFTSVDGETSYSNGSLIMNTAEVSADEVANRG